MRRARIATLATVWLAIAAGLSFAAAGLFMEPDRVRVTLGAVGLLVVALALGAAVLGVLTPSLVPAHGRRLLLLAVGAAALSVPLIAPVAAGEWQTWAWVGGTLAGTAPLLLGPRRVAAAAAAVTLVAGAIAATHDASVAGAAFIVVSVGLTVASMCLLPTRIWTLLADVEAGREAQARLAAADERLRFSRDVHDVLGHSLTVIALHSELAARLAPVDGRRAADAATEAQRQALAALEQVRHAVHGFQTVDLADQLEAITQIMRTSGVRCTVAGPAEPLEDRVAALCATVVREASTNVLRHSRAAWCSIEITRTNDRVRLLVTNDGVGTVPADAQTTGLQGLRERLAAAGGSLLVQQQDGTFALEATMTSAA